MKPTGSPSVDLGRLTSFPKRVLVVTVTVVVPDDVSMICASNEVLPLAWCQPKISHFSWDRKLLVKRVDRWAGRVSKGQKDVRQSFIPAELILGGTIGPAKR